MNSAAATETPEQWRSDKFGEKVRAVMSRFYPLGEEPKSDRVRVSVRLEEGQSEDLDFVADLWNAYDKALGIKRRHKWKSASVIERLLTVSLRGIWEQLGEHPRTKEERDDLLRRASDAIREEEAERHAAEAIKPK